MDAALVSTAAGETDLEDADLVRSLASGFAGSVNRELQFQVCVSARRSGPSVRLNAHATASESTGIIGSLVCDMSESSLPNSDNSSMGVACVDLASAAVASLAPVCSSPRSRAVCAAGAVHARRTVSPMHAAYSHESWSDTVSLQGPRGRKRVKEEVFGPAEDLRPVSEVEAGVNFRLGRRCTEAGCRFTSQEATRHGYQARQGRCGHTFPPPGGSWYPIRVTCIRIGHQAINELDEGVWNRSVRDLGAKGVTPELVCSLPRLAIFGWNG